MKMMDTRAYVGMLKELVEQGREMRMVISGSSMAPFLIHGRDSIFFRAPERELRRGDIVFYERPGGQFVVHRISTGFRRASEKDASATGWRMFRTGDFPETVTGELRFRYGSVNVAIRTASAVSKN